MPNPSFNPPFATWDMKYGWSNIVLVITELHQLYSPSTVHEFLDRLLEESQALGRAFDETGIYGKYIVDAWKGIIRSRGILL